MNAETFLEKSKKNYSAETRGNCCFELALAEADGSSHAGRGSFAEGPAEGSPYVHLKHEGIKNIKKNTFESS